MPVEITMPQLSDTMSEGTVVKWLKKEGDKVKAGEIIAEIETDKATMEMEAFDAGTIAAIDAKEGSKVKVGDRIALLATGNETVDQVKKGGGAASKSKEASAPAAASQPASTPPAAPVPSTPQRTSPPAQTTSKLRISPLARKIAADRGIDPSQIQGSGPGGRIVQRDLENAKPGSAPAPSAPAAPMPARIPSGQTQVIQLTKMRSVIAQRLQQSKQQVPHFYETMDIDVEELSTMRAKINKQLEKDNIRLSLGDFITKGISVALQRHPGMNAHYSGTQITRFADVHMGMAVALPDGLIVPVLRNVNQMGIKEIRQRSADLIDRARAQKLKGDELSGATFTVSNLGTYGIKEFSAIINPPEVGILAIGSAEKRAVIRNDSIVARTVMNVTLSADHRAVDGASAAEFLRTLKELLEEPGMMLM
ncbi:MAG TPA: dihydrolipoamide acetyltransferase family protein [Tepidisphaeraceae bacterium]|nr:dihydrolipoamide acetyltransferase family protein [Tepidisphaeraceae bacterium]